MVSREIGLLASLTTTVTRKGQVTIPAQLRKKYSIKRRNEDSGDRHTLRSFVQAYS